MTAGCKSLALSAAAGLLIAGCTKFDQQSALDPAGVQAERIHELWRLNLWIVVVVYVVTVGFIAGAVLRRGRGGGSNQPITAPPLPQELRLSASVLISLAITTIVLFVLLVGDFLTGRRIEALDDPNALTIRVTGRQWWWDVQYQDPAPSNIVATANEIHAPVGRTVKFELASGDVIHSFWAPNLHGKTDLIPGRTTQTYLRADRPGTYWGQCAEFCGHQHANMRFLLIAEPEEAFQKWLAAQRQSAVEPATESQKRGRQVFLTRTCVMCHTIAGTTAQSKVGPDLTHLASRPRIAAGTLPNTRGQLAAWVANAQSIKPGVRMPANPLQPDELRSLLDYLESLK